jgi:hypothetical protein
MNNELKIFRRKGLCPNLKNCFSYCRVEMRKTTNVLSQNSRSPDRDFNPVPPENEGGVLSAET